MGWLERYRIGRAARAMAHKLPSIMAKEWGRADYYTPPQVRRALQMTGLAGRYDFLALAAFLTRQAYDDASAAEGFMHDYEAARRLFEKHLPGGFAGTYWQSPVSNAEAISRYGPGGAP
jgi:hypothetical protein